MTWGPDYLITSREDFGSVARKVRIEYPGAIYHLMNRGDHLEAVFADDQDLVAIHHPGPAAWLA